jgi:hypothetical protein
MTHVSDLLKLKRDGGKSGGRLVSGMFGAPAL